MSHPFGDLLSQYLGRKHSLTQKALAEAIHVDPAIITRMCNGKNLTSKYARTHLLAMIKWFYDQKLIEYQDEANALLTVAGIPGLQLELQPEADLLSVLKVREKISTTSQQTPFFLLPSLPAQRIIGRDRELDKILEWLDTSDTLTNTISTIGLRGMGGVGKTTLAALVAYSPRIRTRFPDGVLWTALGPNPSIRTLLENWGKVLNIELRFETDENSCSQRLHSAVIGRRMLFIVDDIWNVKDGYFFKIAGPGSGTIITSRDLSIINHFAVPERTLRVDLLTAEKSLELLRILAPKTVAEDETSAILLCERLEFLPLALTLAGRLLAVEAEIPGRMRHLLQALIDQRQQRLNLFQEESRLGIDSEQVSIRDILGLSVKKLSDSEQQLFAMLSVFGGDPLTWEIEAVASVWQYSVADAETFMSRFIQRGLVEPRGDRYWMHALLADYANELREEMKL